MRGKLPLAIAGLAVAGSLVLPGVAAAQVTSGDSVVGTVTLFL